MVKILILLVAFGLSTMTTLLMNVDVPWKIAAGIIGFGLAYILALSILFFFIVWLLGLGINKNEVPEKFSSKYRKIYNVYQPFLMSLFGVKLTVNGLDKIPQDTNFILFQNHLSNMDPIITDYVLRKYPMIFMSKASLFSIPFFGKFIRKIGYVKLTRKLGLDDTNEIVRGLRWVQDGHTSMCVYPEAKRNMTYPYPELLDLKEGTISMAMKSERPIVVSVIHQTQTINDGLLVKMHKIQLDFIDVIQPEEYKNMSVEEVTKKVHKMMLDEVLNPSTRKEKVRLY